MIGNHDMNVVILAAGLSSRLFPLTKKYPKAALPLFDGKSLLYLTMQNLVPVKTKIHNLLIIGGHGFDYLVDEVASFENELPLIPKIVYNPKYKSINNSYSLLLGIERYLEDDLLILNSDILYDPPILVNLIHSTKTSLA
ncbi:sugar phosphate nucleotidyltransferase, partial [Acidobacteriota bacterium]